MMKKEKDTIVENKSIKAEEMGIEELLIDLRNKKNWNYIDIIQKLSNMGVLVDEKMIKKWEIGLEYPDTDTIYKLSELYLIPATDFIVAKNNSYTKGSQAIHKTFIKWFCYITGFSIKAGYIITYIFLYVALIGAFLFFISKCNELLA